MKKRLGDYIQEYSVRNKNEEDIPVYSVTNTKGFCKDYFGKEVASKKKKSYKIVPKGYFAYNPSRINVGSVDWQRTEDRVIVSPLYNVFSVSKDLEQQYLYYYLKSDMTLHLIKELATGSVRDNLRLAMLYEFPINIPSREIQQKIVWKLDIVKNIILLLKEQLQKLDELIQSRFVEMFGDLADPKCVWNKVKLINVCKTPNDVKCGPFGTQLNKNEYQKKGVAVWEIPQINDEFASEPIHFLTEKKAKILESYSVISGDIVMSRKGNIGKCAVFPDEYEKGIIHSDVLRIRVDAEQVNSQFMMRQLHYSRAIKHQIGTVSSGAIMAGINVTKLKQIYVHIPPIDLQNQFAAFVQQVNKSKFEVQKSLEKTQLLFDSLMQEYFG